MLERATYLHLVTTGPDPRHHRVLEIGAVRIVQGKPEAEFGRLVNPGRPIPAEVARRTGIAEKDVAAAPELRYLLPDFFAFLGRDPVVARDAERSARRFLEAAFGTRLPNRFLDLAELAFLADPVARAKPVPAPPTARALDGARALAAETASLLDRVAAFDPALRAEVARLTRGTRFAWAPLYASAPPDAGPLRIPFPEVDLRARPPAAPPPPPVAIDPDAVAAVFADGGALARVKPGFEHRGPQIEMAREVARALNDRKVLLVEAGTGVGKSLAYLVPLLLWARENHRPVLVSTHTKVLQGQLDRDLELVRTLLDWDFRAVVVKGRSNYLCLHRWLDTHHAALEDADQTKLGDDDPRADLREGLAFLLHWAPATPTGDVRDEVPLWLQERLPAGFFGKVTIDAEHCLGRRCPQWSRCTVTHVREKARQADLVIVNHALLLECLLAERDDILPPRAAIVIDEAHHLENVATDVLSAVSSRRALARMLRELYNPSDRSGLLPHLYRQLGHDPDPAVADAVRDVALQGRKLVEDLVPLGIRFFSQLQGFLRGVRLDDAPSTQYAARVRVTGTVRELAGWQALREANAGVRDALSRMYSLLHYLDVNLLSAEAEVPGEARVPRPELDGTLAQLGSGRRAGMELLGLHREVFDEPAEGRVYWIENELQEGEDGGQWEASLHGAPLDVGPALQEMVFDRHPTVVLTSATLTTSSRSDEFRFVRLRLGLDRLEADRARYVKLHSPFDYAKQVLFVVVSDLPRYEARDRSARRKFFDAARDFLPRMLRANHGGTLVLCTSHEQVEWLHGAARDALAPLGIEVMRQGRGTSARRQVERFREDADSVLIGTYGLWEGIDVPGESLDGLAVVKLPFDPPTEPLIEARREQTIARGLDGNHHYYYPLAIMRLKQGFGRLIRSTSDRGVFVVLDHRLMTRAPYAKQFLNSLPPGMQEPRLAGADEAVRLIEEWQAGSRARNSLPLPVPQ